MPNIRIVVVVEGGIVQRVTQDSDDEVTVEVVVEDRDEDASEPVVHTGPWDATVDPAEVERVWEEATS